MSNEASYTWADAERQFGAECVVAFDRDVAPQGWQVVLRLRGPVLWADNASCVAAHASTLGECDCVMWDGFAWITRVEMRIREMSQRVSTVGHWPHIEHRFRAGILTFPEDEDDNAGHTE